MTTVINVDPELGIFTEDGLVIPACDIFPGKEEPLSIEPQCKSHTTYAGECTIDHDGRAVEFQRFKTGIYYPTCMAWWIDGDWWCLRTIVEHLDKYNIKNKTKLRIRTVAEGVTTEKILAKAGPAAHFSGCNTVYDAYKKGAPTDGIPDYRNHLNVYFGDHVHIACEDESFKGKRNLMRNARLYDIISVIPCALLLPIHGEYNRGKYIGAGFFRPKPYGQEFTSHDSSMLSSPLTQAAVYHTSRLFKKILCSNRQDKYLDVVDSEMVEYAVEHRDHKAMKYIYKQVEEMLMADSALYMEMGLFSKKAGSHGRRIFPSIVPVDVFNRIIDGDLVISNDFVSNWGLGVKKSAWIGHKLGLHTSMGRLVGEESGGTIWAK